MKLKYLIKFAQIYSAVFSPFYATMWAFIWLFLFSYLRTWPWFYKAYILIIVIAFTILLPRVAIEVLRRINRWTHWQLSTRVNRNIPYFFTVASYVACMLIFMQLNTASFMQGMVLATLATGMVCALVNTKWKVSAHMAGMGGLVGVVIAFSYLFYFNPIPPMCLMLVLAGVMGTCRMILCQHSLSQVVVGFFIGFVCSLIFILFVWL